VADFELIFIEFFYLFKLLKFYFIYFPLSILVRGVIKELSFYPLIEFEASSYDSEKIEIHFTLL